MHTTETLPDKGAAFAADILAEIARLSRDTAGVSRPAFSEIETKVLDSLETRARAEGLHVETDAGQNRVFCLPEDSTAQEWVCIGSHVDSVPMGGNYDGLAGVVAGLTCLLRARGQGFPVPVKVLALRGEESAWFGTCYLGSKILTGQLSAKDLATPHRDDGRPLSEHLAALGIDTQAVAHGVPLAEIGRIRAYIELHIEQGPVLTSANLPAAIVSGIRGNFRYRHIRCIGEAGHSGAVPRGNRRDPVLAMTELLSALDRTWGQRERSGADLVITSGMISTDARHHALSKIPAEIGFSLDIRSQDQRTLERMQDWLKTEIARISTERNVRFDLGRGDTTAPAVMDPALRKGLEAAMETVVGRAHTIPSGGGHDAAAFAAAGVPTGMVFVRNQNGSHNPDEHLEVTDLMLGTDILDAFLSAPALPEREQPPEHGYASALSAFTQTGNGLHSYHRIIADCSRLAQDHPQRAAVYTLMAHAAAEFSERHDRMPVSLPVLNSHVAALVEMARSLDRAHAAQDPVAMLNGLNALALLTDPGSAD